MYVYFLIGLLYCCVNSLIIGPTPLEVKQKIKDDLGMEDRGFLIFILCVKASVVLCWPFYLLTKIYFWVFPNTDSSK